MRVTSRTSAKAPPPSVAGARADVGVEQGQPSPDVFDHAGRGEDAQQAGAQPDRRGHLDPAVGGDGEACADRGRVALDAGAQRDGGLDDHRHGRGPCGAFGPRQGGGRRVPPSRGQLRFTLRQQQPGPRREEGGVELGVHQRRGLDQHRLGGAGGDLELEGELHGGMAILGPVGLGGRGQRRLDQGARGGEIAQHRLGMAEAAGMPDREAFGQRACGLAPRDRSVARPQRHISDLHPDQHVDAARVALGAFGQRAQGLGGALQLRDGGGTGAAVHGPVGGAQQGRRNLGPDHRGDLQQPPLGRTRTVDARRDHRLDRGRRGDVHDRLRGDAGPRRALEPAGLGQHAHGFLEEQQRAVGAFHQQPPQHRDRGVVAQQGAGHCLGFGDAERVEAQDLVGVATGPVRSELEPRGDQQHRADAVDALGEALDRREAFGVGSVQVLGRQGQRRVVGAQGREQAQGLEHLAQPAPSPGRGPKTHPRWAGRPQSAAGRAGSRRGPRSPDPRSRRQPAGRPRRRRPAVRRTACAPAPRALCHRGRARRTARPRRRPRRPCLGTHAPAGTCRGRGRPAAAPRGRARWRPRARSGAARPSRAHARRRRSGFRGRAAASATRRAPCPRGSGRPVPRGRAGRSRRRPRWRGG